MALIDTRPRVRPGFRRAAIAVCVLLAPIAAWTVWDYAEAWRLAQVVAEVRATGAPVTPPDMSFDEASRRDNAARFYDAAATILDTTGLDGPTGLLNRLDQSKDPGTSRAMTPEVEAFLARNADAERFLGTATGLAFRAERPVFDFNSRFSSFFRLATVADLRGVERASAGDGDGAVTALVAQLGVARPLGWNPPPGFSVTDLFSAGILARAGAEVASILPLQPSEGALARLQGALAANDRDDTISEQLRGERARLLGAYWNSARRWYVSPPRAFDAPAGLTFVILRPWLAHQVVAQARLLGRLEGAARRPWPVRLQVQAPGSEPGGGRWSPGGLPVFGVPGRDTTLLMHRERTRLAAKTLAILRVALAATAVARFRLAHSGAFPGTLADLTPALLTSVPIDPFSGAPLHYRHDATTFSVYSIGRDQRDDGGRDLNQQLSRRWGSYAQSRDTADIGVQVDFSNAAPR